MNMFILVVLVIIPIMSIVYFKTKSSITKNIIFVAFAISTFFSLYAFAYAFFGLEAEQKARLQAEINFVRAESARKEADANAAEAQEQAETARQIVKRSEGELAKCRGKK